MNAFLMPLALLLGAVLTTQVATNKQLGDHLHNFYIPAVVNMIIGLIPAVALTLYATKDWPTSEMAKGAPWYSWLAGGVLGMVYLTGNILLAPRLGAGALIGLVVTGQIIFSVMVDQFAWFGFEQHVASMPRLIGCLLLVGGVALVSKY
jgi:transporter family-2 protein